jgi:hypothetical protein
MELRRALLQLRLVRVIMGIARGIFDLIVRS